jgi:hypothetical protein
VSEFPIHDVLAGMNPRVEFRHQHPDRPAKALAERVQRADVIAVAVG